MKLFVFSTFVFCVVSAVLFAVLLLWPHALEFWQVVALFFVAGIFWALAIATVKR